MSTTENRRPAYRAITGFSIPRVRRTVQLGFKSLWVHRLRSLLTVLGIVFGVCSVIAMLAVGEGASYEAQEQIRRLGSNNIILRSLKPIEEQKLAQERSYVIEYGLTYEDMRKIKESIPGVTLIMPGRIIRNYVWNGARRIDSEIVGAVSNYPELRGLRILKGRFFTETEMKVSLNVCVLSPDIANALFPIDEPLGRNVRIGEGYYRVVGIIEHESGGFADAGARDRSQTNGEAPAQARMYVPLTAAKNRFGEVLMRRSSGSFQAERVELHEAVVQVANQAEVETTARIIDEIMRQGHKKKDYDIVVPLELLRQAERTKRIFNIVLGAIAAISLLVGGIGIMNIMLASVTERTREIGIRRALGARRRDIIIQFVVETVILSAAGGVIGVALGVVIPLLISYFAGMLTIITPWAPMVAFSISALVGIVFGIYPAMRAANMDPVEALRHE